MPNYISSEGEVTSASSIMIAAERIILKRNQSLLNKTEPNFTVQFAHPWSEEHATFMVHIGSGSKFNLSLSELK
jgi:hypothetical protein